MPTPPSKYTPSQLGDTSLGAALSISPTICLRWGRKLLISPPAGWEHDGRPVPSLMITKARESARFLKRPACRIKIDVPIGGLGMRLDEMHAWPDENCGDVAQSSSLSVNVSGAAPGHGSVPYHII